MTENNCNCVEHWCDGYEAGKNLRGKPVTRLTHKEVETIASKNQDVRFEGNYGVVIYHKPELRVFNSQRTWMLAINILNERCGTNITRLTFRPDQDVETYEYGLVED